MEGCQPRFSLPPFLLSAILPALPFIFPHRRWWGCEVRKERRRGNTTGCGRSESLLGKELLQMTGGLSLSSS